MFSQRNGKKPVGTALSNENNNTDGCSEVVSIITQSNKEHSELKAKSTVRIIDPPTKIDCYDPQSVEDAYIPSVQTSQLNKQDEIGSVPYYQRLLNTMKRNGLICEPVYDKGTSVLRVHGSEFEVIMCTGHKEQDESSEKCKCNKYYPPEYQILGDLCYFCSHSTRFHRMKPEHEIIVFDDTKNESQRNEYKYWFDKFIELQKLYCSTNKNLSFDDNLFIKIYNQSRQASFSFIQSPNSKYVLIKYIYDSVYDEGETLFKTKYQIFSLQTMIKVKTDEDLNHSWSSYRDGIKKEDGFRTILWDLNQPATLIATDVKCVDRIIDKKNDSFIQTIVNIDCPIIN